LLAAIALSATLLGDPIGGPDETLGIPWQGDPGISETVDEIMQRQAVADEEQPDAIREKGAPRKGEGEDDEPGRAARRAHRRHHPPHQNPNAPAVSHWPTGGGVDDTAAGPVDPTVDASGVDAAGDGAADPLAPQSLGIDVVGATLAESGFIPPDAEGAVGPT
jgi:hypothetical protein